MRHRQRGRHLGRDSAHRRAMFRNMVTDLLRYERITTTEAKAKEIRPLTEKMVTLGRKGDLHSRRQAMKYVFDKGVVEHLFDNIGPRMADRPGGYLRITRLEPRKGDNAKMAAIEFVDYWEDEAVEVDTEDAAFTDIDEFEDDEDSMDGDDNDDGDDEIVAEAESDSDETDEDAATEATAEEEVTAEADTGAEATVEESTDDESEADASAEAEEDSSDDAQPDAEEQGDASEDK
jgi:large subunit ribosomal protein L17